MQVIKLNHETWEIDTSKALGPPGGFGEVFRGKGVNGDVAIKRLMVTASDAAHRELQIGKSLAERSLNYIVPILDYGLDADSDRYYIVMPICERSLQDEINNKGKFSAHESIEILLEILSGLEEVSDITHRDLKPPNILLHESKWKIADFGIAKFVEDSTSLETLRDCLTRAYAAPEQWRMERPTAATDIYATGCIAYALMTGQPPFSGSADSLREQHLKNVPQPLADLPPNVRSLVSQMLRKNPAVRPNVSRCINVLRKALESNAQNNSETNTNFAEAISEVATQQAQKEAEHLARQEREQTKREIYNEAALELNRIRERLFDEIENHAQDVIVKNPGDMYIRIGNAMLVFDTRISADTHVTHGIHRCDPDEIRGGQHWGVHNKQSSWDMIAMTSISVEQRAGSQTYKRCANLILGRPNENFEFRWYEMAFWSPSPRIKKDEPFCLDYAWDIDKALINVMGENNLAYNPVPIDAEDEDTFIEYWMNIIAQAMIEKLVKPSSMPMER